MKQKKKKKNSISRKKDIIKIKAKINEIETNLKSEKINETKNWLFEKINKMDKPLARLIKIERESSNKILSEKGKITMSQKHKGSQVITTIIYQ